MKIGYHVYFVANLITKEICHAYVIAENNQVAMKYFDKIKSILPLFAISAKADNEIKGLCYETY